MLDNVVNGNVTTNGSSFFIGVDPLITQVGVLNTNFSNIQTQLSNLNNTLDGMVPHLQTMRNNIQKVPNNALAGGNAPLIYNTKISDAFGTTTGTTESMFAGILGSSNTSGIIGTFYTSFSNTTDTLDSIRAGAASFVSGAGSFGSSISTVTNDLNKVKTQINDLDSSLSSALDVMETPKSAGTLVISLIYGIMLGLSVLALLGVVLMTFCDKYKCRYLMYFSCVILFFLGILGFLLAIIFSILVPVIFLMCEWLDVTMTSTGFNTNTQKFISDTQVRNIVSTCLVGGNGDIIAAIGAGTVSNTINGLRDSIQKTNSFNTSSTLADINTALANITQSINKFKNGEIIDVTDTDSITALTNIANSQNLGACAALNTNSFVPSMVNTSAIGCSLASGAATINPTSCTQANFESNACTGCVDTSLVFNAWYTSLPQGGWKTKLDTKFGAGCTSAWNTYFGNVWDNYYRIKTSTFSGISTRWAQVSDSTNPASDISVVTNDLNSINGTMTSVINTLKASFDSIVHPQYGMIAGLNCQLIG